jgi:NDP-sugar pyrophosphorylase family protein
LIGQDDSVVIGLPDTVWSPADGFRHLPNDELSFLLFPVQNPELFDAVVTDEYGAVEQVQVKQRGATTNWVWGAIKMPSATFHALHKLWLRPERRDEYFGTLVNAWLAEGGKARGVRAGQQYVDVGTLHGYRAALRVLERDNDAATNATEERQGAIQTDDCITTANI